MSVSRLAASQLQFRDWEAAQEYYVENGLTDGLPIVPPTPEKTLAMLGYAGLPPDAVIGYEIIRKKRFTAEKVAINAVMAGCKPEYFPVVSAAVAATCERSFNFHASSTSTNGITTMVVVSGPYASEIGMNSSTLLLGNGNRANATIGRAVNLVKTNFYGSAPHDMDKSALGHPGKYSFCFAENLEVSPWPSLAEFKGFDSDASIVTVFAANSPIQVSIYGDKAPESILTAVAHSMSGLGHSLPEVAVVISPEVLSYLAEARWSREQVQEFLCRKTQHPAREWAAWKRLERPEAVDPEQMLGVVSEPSRITVVPGGGAAGAFVSSIASWGSSRSVTTEIQVRR